MTMTSHRSDAPPVWALLEALPGYYETPPGSNHFMACCPAHDDRTPSLSIGIDDDSRVLLHCFGGCSQDAVRDALGARWSHFFPFGKPTGEKRYTSFDKDGKPHAHRRYYDEKGETQRPWTQSGVKTEQMRLYRSERLKDAPSGSTVYLCEGEPATDALLKRNVPTVGTVCGAGVTPCDEALCDLRKFTVLLWPDNDDSGHEHMRKIAARFTILGVTVAGVINDPTAPPKGDAVDYFAHGGTVEGLAALIDTPNERGERKEEEAAPEEEDTANEEGEKGEQSSSDGASNNSDTSDDDDVWRPMLQPLADLMAKELPPVRWIVDGLIPDGVTLIGAKAKKGKTALMMHIGCSVAGGNGTLGSVSTEQVEVLYLAMEDNERRFQKRMRQMLEGRTPPAGFYLVNGWPPLDHGGLDAFERLLDERPTIGLIIVDTLEHIRPARRVRDGVYADDYSAVRGLQRLAGERRVAIVPLHHLRKAPAEDVFDEFNGSMGLMASVDNAIVLRSVNGVNGMLELHRRGRDYEDDTPLAIKGDKRTLLWSLTGEAQEAFRSAQRQAIVDLLKKHPAGMRPKEIALALSKNETTTRRLLQKLLDESSPRIVNRDGVYIAVSPA